MSDLSQKKKGVFLRRKGWEIILFSVRWIKLLVGRILKGHDFVNRNASWNCNEATNWVWVFNLSQCEKGYISLLINITKDNKSSSINTMN